MRTNEIENEIDETKKWEEKIKRKDLKYKTIKYTQDFQQYKTIKSSGEGIYTRKDSIVEAEKDQSNLLENLVESDNKSRSRNKEGTDKKRDI